MDKQKNIFKSLIVSSIILAVSLVISFILIQRNGPAEKIAGAIIQPVSAQEIYPMFLCPCCGQPLDPKNICCGMAKEMIAYIDDLAEEKLSENEIILAFVKKYGLNTFADKNKEKEFKEELVKNAPNSRPIIVLEPETYDFGDVSQKAGKVYTYFTLKNEGESDLVIDKMATSCGCTFVAVVYRNEESPFFTMPGHGSENPKWDGVSIPAGATAQLKVMYDPDVHQDFRGAATREIYIYSNDPIDFEKKVQVELNQVD